MRILFVIDQLVGGGAAKKLVLLANALSSRGHSMAIATNTYKPIAYHISENVSLNNIYNKDSYKKNRIIRFLSVRSSLRKLVSRTSPDVVVSVLPHVSFFVKLSLLGMKVPIVFSDETSFARKDRLLIHFIRHYFYNVADAVVVLTENDIKILGKNIPKKVAIHNPVDCPRYNKNSVSKEKIILAIGPLAEWDIKGFDLLFKAFKPLADLFPDWKIAIAGDSKEPYKSIVEGLIKDCHLDGRVELLGFQTNIFGVMAKSSIYALSSRIEGFSLSLVEALSQGCACLAFENYGVIDEVSRGGKGVLTVKDGDVEGFSKQLCRLIYSPEERIRLAEEGKSVVSAYDLDKIATQWENLFTRLSGNTH